MVRHRLRSIGAEDENRSYEAVRGRLLRLRQPHLFLQNKKLRSDFVRALWQTPGSSQHHQLFQGVSRFVPNDNRMRHGFSHPNSLLPDSFHASDYELGKQIRSVRVQPEYKLFPP